MRPIGLLLGCVWGVLAGCGSDAVAPPPPARDGGTLAPDFGNAAATTGLACDRDEQCDPIDAGAAAPYCSTSLAAGSLSPTPVCMGAPCDAGDGTLIHYCDKNTGVCLPTGGPGEPGLCMPSCDFRDDGAAPTGCTGNNACNVYGWGVRDDSRVVGIGYCFGGCVSDSDCQREGERCQPDDGLCRKTLVSYPKKPGEACKNTASGAASRECNCLSGASGDGYCSIACRFGVSGVCPEGFSCDPGLPRRKLRDDDVVFTRAPAGITGHCLKNCASDEECAPLGAHCEESAGMDGQRTCQIGERRCADDTHCEGGRTCIGVTAVNLGTCE